VVERPALWRVVDRQPRDVAAGSSSRSLPERELRLLEDNERVALGHRLALLARISLTVPSSSASTGISIFIDSRMTSVSPSAMSWPTEHSIFQTVPCDVRFDVRHGAQDTGAVSR
jgi:hypothetical protein